MASTADPRWARPAEDGTSPVAGAQATDRVHISPVASGRAPWSANAVMDELTSTGHRYLWGAPLVGGDEGAVRAAGIQLGSARVTGGLLVVAAGVMTIVGSGMRWATIRALGLVEIPLRGTDADQFGGTTLLLGVLSVLLGGLLVGWGRAGWGWILAAVTGSMIVLMVVVDLFRLLRDSRLAGVMPDISVEVGPGLWITLVGGLLVVAGAVLARLGARCDRPARMP